MIAETLARARDNQVALGVKQIGGAAAFQQAAEKNPTAPPALFVFLVNEQPRPGQFSGDFETDIQRIDLTMAVVIVVRNVADATGEAAGTDVETIRGGLKGLLLGWVPLAGYAPLERGAGHLLAFRDGHLWWQDLYTSTYYERKPQ